MANPEEMSGTPDDIISLMLLTIRCLFFGFLPITIKIVFNHVILSGIIACSITLNLRIERKDSEHLFYDEECRREFRLSSLWPISWSIAANY